MPIKLTQPTGLLLRPNPRQGGQEHHLILGLLSPCSSKSHQPLSGPCGKTLLVQNPMASVKTPASLHRPACNRPVRWEPLSLGISNVFTPSQGPTTCAQTEHSKEPAPPSLPGIKTGFTKLPQPLVSVLCLPETSYSRHWMVSSEELLSRDPSLTRALRSAGRGGAGVKDDPGNSAWQCSKEKHCPRLVDVHIGQCAHKGRRKTTQEGKETKATGEQGIQAGTATPQQPQRPSPEQSTSFSSKPNSAQGPVFRAVVVRRSRYWRAAATGAGTGLGWDRTAWPGGCNQALVWLLR